MLLNPWLLALTASLVAAQKSTQAKSYTGWDCCKPICAAANGNNNLVNSRGVVKTCDKNNKPMSQSSGIQAGSACMNGNGYLCDNYQPIPVADDLSYGFAIQVSSDQREDNSNCCKCYEVLWLSGQAAGKKMVVQIVTPGGSGGPVKKDDLIILTPGGGVGPLGDAACRGQYGTKFSWYKGPAQGGLTERSGCEKVPDNLAAGCYWRFNWAGGDMLGWDIVYNQVTCPARLTSISGCEAKYP
ncbi:barwin-like endoglucanase [Thozetella sp. PMI_491]|nr:barwin-like endoglucanase [Thozetella sp. PMI_491]